MMLIIYLSLHLLFSASYNILTRKFVKQDYNRIQLGVLLGFGLAFGSMIAWVIKYKTFSNLVEQIKMIDSRNWLLILATSFIFCFTIYLPVKALQHCDVNTYTLLWNIRIVLAPILALALLGEKYNGLRMVGGFVILVSIVILTYRSQRTVDNKGIYLALTAGVIFAIVSLIEKQILTTIPRFTYMVLGFGIGSIFLYTYYKATNGKEKSGLNVMLKDKGILILMACRYGSAIFFVSSLATGDVSLATFVSSSVIIIIALAGYFLLGEKDHIGTKIVSTLIAVVGLVIIYISG